MRNSILLLVLLFFFDSCLKDGPFKSEYNGYIPVEINDDWVISNAQAENIDSVNLEQAYRLLYRDDRYLMARCLLVIRNGKLVAEAYPHAIEDRDQFANIQSCTKSVTSIMVGIAMQNGMDISVGDRLYDIYPDLFDGNAEKQEITLADALTMRTGLAFDNDKNSRDLYMTKKNSAAFVLGFPMVDKPGTVWNYNDGAPQLVSKMIETKTGETEAAYADGKLFKPLGITDWKWESAHDGTSFGAYGLYLKPRDLAKIGQLLLQKGKWSGKTIIDSTYLAQATSVKVDSADDGSYGYYFWVDSRNHGFYAYGHGGQLLLVVPYKNLVLLYTAWSYTSGDFFDDGFDMFDLIVDGCR